MKGGVYLSDREWMVLETFVPKVKRRKEGKGRPRRDSREVFNGIVWILFPGTVASTYKRIPSVPDFKFLP